MFLKVASEEILQFKSEEQWRLTQGRWIRKGTYSKPLGHIFILLPGRVSRHLTTVKLSIVKLIPSEGSIVLKTFFPCF